jgi:transposase
MTKDEEPQALREENRMLKALVAEMLPLKEQLAQANARIKELEDRLAQDSRTSIKPPSSDGFGRLPRGSHRPSGKRPGGQNGHPGHTLSMVEQPDEVVRHRPKICSQCNRDLSAVPGIVAERRQVLDLPEIRLLAYEHQIETICCPTCHGGSLGSFPASVSAPMQYGPNLQALAVYLRPVAIAPHGAHLRGAGYDLRVSALGRNLAPVEQTGSRVTGSDSRAHCRAARGQSAPVWR